VDEIFLKSLSEKHGIVEYFLLPDDAEIILSIIAIRAMEELETIRGNNRLSGYNSFISKQYRNFINSFSTCAVCGSKNHILTLLEFYHASDPVSRSLRRMLMTLVGRIAHYKEDRPKKMRLGIPCCACFEKYCQ